MCWGTLSNYVAQNNVPTSAAGQELFSATPIQIVSGRDHHIALMSDGTVWGYGYGGDGQIGDGGNSNSFRQVSIGGEALTGVVEVFAGSYDSCVKHTDGSLTCFGADWYGQTSETNPIFDGSSPATSAKLVATGKHSMYRFHLTDAANILITATTPSCI